MKRYRLFALLLCLSIFISGCNLGNQVTNPTLPPTGNVAPDMVMIEGTEYIVRGKSGIVPNAELITGNITSLKENNSPFTQDDQANFPDALNQPYAFVEGQLLLCIKGTWLICQPLNTVEQK